MSHKCAHIVVRQIQFQIFPFKMVRYNARHLRKHPGKMYRCRNIHSSRYQNLFILPKKSYHIEFNINSILNEKKKKKQFDSQNSSNVGRKSKAEKRTAPTTTRPSRAGHQGEGYARVRYPGEGGGVKGVAR